MARLSDYQNVTVDSRNPGGSGMGGCGWVMGLAVILILAGVVMLVLVRSQNNGPRKGPALNPTENVSAPAPTTPAPTSAAPRAQPVQQTPSTSQGSQAAKYTMTVRTTEAAHVKITQISDGTVVLDEIVKPSIPTTLLASGRVRVESDDNLQAVRVTVGSRLYGASTNSTAISFTVSPPTK